MRLNKNLPRWRGIKGVVSAQALQNTYWQNAKIMVKQLRFLPLASTVFALLLASTLGISQPGFMEKYDFGSGASFHNVLLLEDTLIIAGTTFDIELNQWGALLVKMDTLGTILYYKLHLGGVEEVTTDGTVFR